MSLIISIGFVSASDMNDTNTDIVTQSSEIDLTDINEDGNLEIEQEKQIYSQADNSRVIYIGQNKTTDGGNGTIENPFESFELACNNLSGEKKVEINVYNGTYYLNSDLKFNTSNLFINGMGEVIIKNLRNEPGAHASFGLTSSNGNFTFSNLIFDASNCKYNIHNLNSDIHFYVFDGFANLGEFYNCTFTSFSNAVMLHTDFSKKFKYCNFINTNSEYFFFYPFRNPDVIMEFDYCIFSGSYGQFSSDRIKLDENGKGTNITFSNVWFGSNSLPSFTTVGATTYNGYYVDYSVNINRYAKFSAYENYLGNDTYEIVGRLVWNDGSIDGLDKLNPMIVKISSKTGDVNKTVILENGTFKTTYISKSSDNYIEIDLDFEEVILEFNNGIQVVANPIYYGEDQIITVTVPQSTNCNISITVNNKTYNVSSNGMTSFNFTVPDELLAGNYPVDVKLEDVTNHLYGMDSTNWTISKINRNMIVTTPAGVCINDESIIMNILLANDASGNITVYVGNKNITQECMGKNTEINITSLLNKGENDVKIIYSGNKKYSNQTKEEKIFVNGMYPNINITMPENLKIGDEINITIHLPQQASGNIIVSVGDKNLTINNVSKKNTMDIADLLIAGNNTVFIKYSGDNFWNSQIKKETIYLSKLTPIMSINTTSIVKVGEDVLIKVTLPRYAVGNLSIEFNGKKQIFNLYDVINISNLVLGKNTINITYSGDNMYYPQSMVVNITVVKWNISLQNMSLEVTNHTNPIFSVKLPEDITGNVTIAINDNTYNLALVNGSADLKVFDLYPGTYNAKISFNGDDKYNDFSENLMFTVPKPVLKANDINLLYTSNAKFSVQVLASGSPVIGKTVILSINGKKINIITDSNGYASVKIDLPPKSTKYTVITEYQGVKTTNYIKVNTIVQAKNVKVKKSAKILKIKVSLKKINNKYLKGKKITLKFKGKKYTVKTNKKGVATFKIKKNILKKLKNGKKYKYQVNYLKDIVTKNIIVKK